jgi:integrase
MSDTIIPQTVPTVRAVKKIKRNRRNTETFKQYYGGFCGWKKFEETLKNDVHSLKTKQIMMGLMKFGCRVMELPRLTKRQINIDFSPTQIMVQGMYVEKQKEALYLVDTDGKPLLENGRKLFRYESKAGYRTFPIRKDEPLSDELIAYVNSFKNDSDTLFPYSYGQMRYRIWQVGMVLPEGVSKTQWAKYHGPWWCHRIRSERACQLIKEYGYDTFRLKKWFGWSSSQMPDVYSDIMPTDLISEKPVDWR